MIRKIGLNGKLQGKKKIIAGAAIVIVLGSYMVNFMEEKEETPPDQITMLELNKNKNLYYLSDENYESNMQKIVLPYIQQYCVEGTFNGYEDVSIHYKTYRHPKEKAKIVIQHGFTENISKYQEAIYYFLKNGYSVYAMDLRGHGHSEREVRDECKIYVKQFNNYVEDLKCFMDQIVMQKAEESSCFLYAHSMGGAVGAYFLESYPNYFKAAVLSSPMLQINCGEYPEKVTVLIANIMDLLGDEKDYIWGQGPFSADYNFEESSCGTEERYRYYLKQKKEIEEYQTNGGTFAWLKTSIAATHRITSKKYASKVKIPTLLFQAGNDAMVKKNGQYRYVKNAENTQLIYVEDAKHEIFTMDSEIRVPYYNTIFEFLEKYSSEK